MESMDEILDLDELQEGNVDETLKEFMSKDEEVAKSLKDKIDELNSEEEKLSKKEEEIKGLEESNREKISANASPEELIEIAGKLKEAEEELSTINDNIKKLESEREELVETKNNIENSKQEYIKNLNSTNSNFEEQLRKISEAIEVCDNPALKQALQDVKTQKEKELALLQENRNNELKTVLNEKEEIDNNSTENVEDYKEDFANVEDNKSIDVINNTQDLPLFNDNVLESTEDKKIESSIETPINTTEPIDNINYNEVIPSINENKIELEPKEEIKEPIVENNNMINIDSILLNPNEENNTIEENSIIKPDLNIINTDDLVLPDVNISDLNNESKVKIIFEKNVPDVLLKEIFSSSKIIPSIDNYLSDKGGLI